MDGTIPASAVEQPMREIHSVIASMGLVPSAADLTQLDQAIDLKVAAVQPDLSRFVDTERTIATTAPLTGGGSLAADLALGIQAASAALPDHVILRDAAGRAQVAAPEQAADITTRAYADSALQVLEERFAHSLNALEERLNAQVEELFSSGLPGRAIDYSLEEQWTGRFWIDGRKIHQKTIDCGPLKNAAVQLFPHGIENLGDVISHEAFTHRDADGLCNPLPFAHPDALGGAIRLQFYRDNISISCGSDRRAFGRTYVTLRYTCTDR